MSSGRWRLLPTADWDDTADRATARDRRPCRDLERRAGGPNGTYVAPSLLDRPTAREAATRRPLALTSNRGGEAEDDDLEG